MRLGRNVAQAAEHPERIFNIRPSYDMRREGTDAEVPVSWHSAFKTAKKMFIVFIFLFTVFVTVFTCRVKQHSQLFSGMGF